MTLSVKSPGTTWLGTETFEDVIGTVPHLIGITGETAPEASVTDTAPEVSHSLAVALHVLAERPICRWDVRARGRLKVWTR
jgi:hypothetical protein